MDFEQVRNIIAESLGCDVEQVTLEAALVDDLGADSLASVELAMALEEAEQIYLTDTDVSEITSFGYSNGETELSFVKEEDTWYSETDREVNLNQSSVENMLSQIAYISADRKLEDPDGLADYGLEDPVYTLWYTTESGETVTVLVGNAAGSNLSLIHI